MKPTRIFCCSLLFSLTMVGATEAGREPISNVIEQFVTMHFPTAQSHYWVVNSTEWGVADEVVVDVNTITHHAGENTPSENRFLLLIVAGQLQATQSIPLGAIVDCSPEEVI